jgi:carbon storage regulator
MLVLSRKVGEAVLADGTYLKVLEISGGKVKLGFLAPDNVSILREELLRREPATEAAEVSS